MALGARFAAAITFPMLVLSGGPAPAQMGARPIGPARVATVAGAGMTLELGGGQSIAVQDLSRATVSREYSVGLGELKVGLPVMVVGGSGQGGAPTRAALIRLLPPDELPGLPPARQGGPTFGRVKSLDPLVLATGAGDVTLLTDGGTEVLAERTVGRESLAPGQSVLVVGGAERPQRVVIMQERPRGAPGAPQQGGAGAGGQPRGDSPRGGMPRGDMQRGDMARGDAPRAGGLRADFVPPTLPLPPEPAADRFDRRAMDRSLGSRFGIKDAVMLREDLLSWNDGYAEAMAELGVWWMESAASFGLGPSSVVRRDGTSDWQRFDRLVLNAQAANIHTSVILHATEPGIAGRVAPRLPSDMAGFRRFVQAAVERYDGDGTDDMPGLRYPVRHWKIEDEAMLPRFFEGSGADYARIVAAAHDSVKAADPGATVILSMLRGYDVLGGPVAAFMEEFFAAIAALGRGPLWDVMDHHWMIDDDAATQHLQHRYVARELQEVRASAARHGIAMRPLWIMETAGVTATEQGQATDLFKRFVYAFSQGAEKVFWSGLKESPKDLPGAQAGGLFRKAALIDAAGTRKLAFHTLRQLVRAIDGFDGAAVRVLEDQGGLFVAEFRVAGAPVWIAWNDAGSPRKLTFRTPLRSAALELEEAVPRQERGAEITGGAADFRRTAARTTADGEAAVSLDRFPVIIRPAR